MIRELALTVVATGGGALTTAAARLVVVSQGVQRSVHALEGDRLVIGRGDDCHVSVAQDPVASRTHASVEPSAFGAGWQVSDLGSTYGTRLNGVAVQKSSPLSFGDEIELGMWTVIRFESLKAAPAAPPEDPADLLMTKRLSSSESGAMRALIQGSDIEIKPASSLRLISEQLSQETPTDQAERFSVLLTASHLLSRPESLDSKLSRILELLFRIFDFDRATLVRWTDEPDGYEVMVARVRDNVTPAGDEKLSLTILQRVREIGVALLTADATEEIGSASVRALDIRMCACVPLVTEKGALGALYAVRSGQSSGEGFGRDDLMFLSAFASEASLAIENAQLAQVARREAEMRVQLARFFPRTALEHVMASEATAGRGQGRITRAALLMADIRNYTQLAQSQHALQLADILEKYFAATVPGIFANNGVVEKFIGDAVCAFWAPPVTKTDMEFLAASSALAIRSSVVKLNAQAKPGAPQIEVGIGLHVGKVYVCQLGDENYLQLAAVGEPTVRTARYCSAAAGGQILASPELVDELSGRLPAQELEALSLKGYSEPVPAFSL